MEGCSWLQQRGEVSCCRLFWIRPRSRVSAPRRAQWKYKPDAKGSAAGLYAIKGPRVDKMLKPVGMFNASRVMAEGSRLEHWLNGKLVVKIEIDPPNGWLSRASKFKKRPTFGTKKGRIMLQDHGGKVWFRKLKIREL